MTSPPIQMMMPAELSTSGQVYYPEISIPLWYNPHEMFDPDLGAGSRMRIVVVENGTGILRLKNSRVDFIAPTLFCLDETDRPVLEHSLGLGARGIYFHPAIIHSAFTFENIRGQPEGIPALYAEDRSTLSAFIGRSDHYLGHLMVSLTTAARVSQLVDLLRHELVDQHDAYWRCRSRSFLLELLCVSERLFMMSDQAAVDAPPVPPTTENCWEDGLAAQSPAHAPGAGIDVNSIVLYLHNHYHERISISQLARMFHTNRTTLAQLFRKTTGLSVMAYLSRLRISQASLMLRETVLPVTEVMDRVGFQDSANFWRVFRKHTGHSPSEYREQFCWLLH